MSIKTPEVTMEIQLIECKKVEFRKTDKDLRAFSKEAAQGIASSIQAEGMYNAIVVRANHQKPGFYLGVQGKHRHYAKATILKEPFIECNVLDMDDAEAEMAMITENLFRNELSAAQKALSIKKWFAYFASKHPDKVGKGKAGGAANKARAESASATTEDEGGAKAKLALAGAVASEPDKQEAKSFAETVAAATGVSQRTAKREQRIAVNLTEEQLEVCDQMQLTKSQMESLAGIKDETKRAEVVNLIASGMEFDGAWTEVSPEAKKVTGKSKETTETEALAKEEKQPELSDDEWFEKFCGDKSRMLSDPAKYKVDALVFRKITDQRHTFRTKVKSALRNAKAGRITGPFFHVVNRITSVSHPKDWFLCSSCARQGQERVRREVQDLLRLRLSTEDGGIPVSENRSRRRRGTISNPLRFADVFGDDEMVIISDPYRYGFDRRRNGEIVICIDRELTDQCER